MDVAPKGYYDIKILKLQVSLAWLFLRFLEGSQNL